MSLLLPGARSPLRDLFEVTDLAEPRKLPSFSLALRSARKLIEGDKAEFGKAPAVSGVNAIGVKADGDIVLFHVGKRGAHRLLWTFGNLTGNSGPLPLSDVIGAA